MSRYALVGATTNDLLTFRGRVLIHGSRHELEFLFPRTRVVEVRGDVGPELPIRDHPGLSAVRWPLDRGEFR